MPEEPDQLRTALSWDVALQIERAVTEFEVAWRKGTITEIEGVLRQNSTVPARELFCALLETELELRRINGETPGPNQWTERFPQWSLETERIVAQSLPGEFLAEDRTIPLPRIGEQFGRYRILREVGRGAMGIVFEAEVLVGEIVALKVIRLPRLTSEDERQTATRLFHAEASATAALDHFNIIPIREVGDVQGIPYFTMPFVAEGTLKDLKSEGPLDPVRASRIIEAAARALHHAHRSGLFHRDIKPSNILVGPNDHVFVTDFGVSLHRDELGRGPSIAGTPLYMSPEQIAGKSDLIDGRSDVFSLGIVLYELLTGAHPFDSPLAASAEIIERICHVPVPPLRQRSDIPRPLEDICLKALRRQPEDRYSTAADFADALAEFIQPSDQPRTTVRSNRNRLLAAIALILVLVAIGIISGIPSRPTPNEPAKPLQAVANVDVSSTPTNDDPDRTAAEWLFSQKIAGKAASISLHLRILNSIETKVVVHGEPLPDEPFRIVLIQAWQVPALTDAAVSRYFSPLRELAVLEISFNNDLSAASVPAIAQIKQLKRISLVWTKITGADCCKLFAALPSLKSVSLSAEQFTDEVAEFVRSSPTLTSVGIHNASDAQVRQLLSAKHLTELSFYTDCSAKAATWQAMPESLPNLVNLLVKSANVTDADLEPMARCPRLRSLHLHDMPITDRGLLSLQSCHSLRSLNVTKTQVTDAGAHRLHARLPQCRIHWDGGVVEPVADSDVDPAAEVEQIIDRLQVESNDDIRAALLLALGEHDAVKLSGERCAKLQPVLVNWYEHAPSAILHSAILWLARRWENVAIPNQAASVKRHSLSDALRSRRLVLEQKLMPRAGGWFQPMHGPTMVVIPGRRSRETSDQAGEKSLRTLTSSATANSRTFAIATAEVTEQQFYYVHETHWQNPKPAHPDQPRTNVSWQEAAWFCNRLSELEGIQPAQQCYEQFTDAMGVTRQRAKANALDLSGYRLPTTEEWEYVGRHTSSDELSRPNGFGLFNTLANASEWVHESGGRRSRETSDRTLTSSATENSATASSATVIRVARTIPPARVDPQRLVAVFAGPASHPDDPQVVGEANPMANGAESEFVPFDENEIVTLGAWPRGRIKARRFRVANLSDQPVTVVKTYLGGQFDFRDPLPKTIEPHASAEFSITVRDMNVGARSGDLVLTFKSDDRDWKFFGKVAGNVHGTVMAVFEGGISGRDRSALAFDFQTVPLNAQVIHGFGVHSRGDEPLRIEKIEVPDGFFLEPGWEPLVAPLGGFRVRVDTTKTGDLSGPIRVHSNDSVEPVFVFPVHARVSDSPRFSVIGVFRAGRWLFDHNRDGQPDEEISFGKAGDKPITGDVNGDGICDVGVCRGGIERKYFWEFYLRGVKEQPRKRYLFGKSNRVPLLTDPLGTGIACPTIVGPDPDQRSLLWEFDTDGDGEPNKELSYLNGEANAKPVAGDWNGDGISDPASVLVGDAVSQFQNRWKLRLGPKTWTDPPLLFGSRISIPIVGDWDADGRSQIGAMEFLGHDTGRIEFRLACLIQGSQTWRVKF